MKQADTEALCDAAKRAWEQTAPRARSVIFTWRKKKYKSVMTGFRMLVATAEGVPVCCRYHDW